MCFLPVSLLQEYMGDTGCLDVGEKREEQKKVSLPQPFKTDWGKTKKG